MTLSTGGRKREEREEDRGYVTWDVASAHGVKNGDLGWGEKRTKGRGKRRRMFVPNQRFLSFGHAQKAIDAGGKDLGVVETR